MGAMPEWLTVGELAVRSGVAPSALRFYEGQGLIFAERSPGNQRRFHRSTLRRVAVIRAGQAVGLPLRVIGDALKTLPSGRSPTTKEWARLAKTWKLDLQGRIDQLESLRDDLSSCIGCGCLSVDTCALLNADDRAASRGPGARYLLGDAPD
jgi:MerR family redox-sensitive transcriptional activator SoxR